MYKKKCIYFKPISCSGDHYFLCLMLSHLPWPVSTSNIWDSIGCSYVPWHGWVRVHPILFFSSTLSSSSFNGVYPICFGKFMIIISYASLRIILHGCSVLMVYYTVWSSSSISAFPSLEFAGYSMGPLH